MMPIYLSQSSGAGLFRIAQFKIVPEECANEPFCTVFRPKMSETEHASREPYCPSNQAADPSLEAIYVGALRVLVLARFIRFGSPSQSVRHN
jgi:hypothetical protein